MALSTGTSQGKRLSSEGLTVEALPVLSGSFIAGCVTAGFFLCHDIRPGFWPTITTERPHPRYLPGAKQWTER
jgi:hypothetical protein